MEIDARPVLVVDDDPTALNATVEILRRAKFPVIPVQDPRQAISQIRQHKPRMIVLDQNMPELDGLTLLPEIREFTSAPVVMLTGMDTSDTAKRALRLGAFDYLTKPVNVRKLLDVVQLALGTTVDHSDRRIVSHYELRREIGRGGMGIVYEARDVTLDRLVAIKLLLPELGADIGYETRFLNEARAAAQVSHPGLVTVYEAGRHRGRLYIAMELVQGITLFSLQASGYDFSVSEAIDITRQAAEALGAAHGAGLVHRDVKPPNLMLTSDAQVKILDFGLARSNRGRAEPLTEAGLVMGTPGYAAPEMMRGDAADFRSDIYSLGVILYEMLIRQSIFFGSGNPADEPHLASGLLRQPPPMIAAVPEPLKELVLQMLSPHPANRPSSTRAVLVALERARRALR